MNLYEKNFEKKHLQGVVHTTLNPNNPGVVRLHLVPSKFSFFRLRPSIVIVNGKDIIPLNPSWTILLAIFIEEINKYRGEEISDENLTKVVDATIYRIRNVYRDAYPENVKMDLWNMVNLFTAISNRNETNINVGQVSIGQYAKYMKAPHRMDLMISSLKKDNHWNCNQKCMHCYAANQEYSETKELTTEEWKKVIDICRKNCIPQLTFTGGEPTIREDLVELVDYAKWFVTRLNTNGVLLTKELCQKLYEASLDSVQVTLYSYDREIHNKLVGSDNYDKTVEGIRNALEAGLNVSINTPLCELNKDYLSTLKFAKDLGLTYATSSGLIVTGNATTEESIATQLTKKEMTEIMEEACKYAEEVEMELAFTSPGWMLEEDLKRLKLDVPGCGACLSNMAITPDGNVVPCQSWLAKNASMGNILKVKWKKIWNSKKCKKIRKNSAKNSLTCPLRGGKRYED